MDPKYIDYEVTGENLFFLRDDGHKVQVEKGSAEAEQLFEEVAKNRDLAGINGEEAKVAREQAEAAPKEDPKAEDGVTGANEEDAANTGSGVSSNESSEGKEDGAGAAEPDGGEHAEAGAEASPEGEGTATSEQTADGSNVAGASSSSEGENGEGAAAE